MGWGELLGGLAEALGGSPGGRGASRPAREPRVERLPPRERPPDERAEAEAETRRMVREAAREMTRDFLDTEVNPWRKRIEETEAKVTDIDSGLVGRFDRIERALEEIHLKTVDAARLETRINALILLVVALLIVTVWLGLR